MENSILNTLPAELRLKIYKHVFEGAQVVVSIHESKHGTEDRPLAEFTCSDDPDHASLVKTCRDIRTEALPVLFSESVVIAKGTDHIVWLDDLNKVIGDGSAKYVRHIRNVRLPRINERSRHSPHSAMELLEKYPKLETCGFSMGPFYEDFDDTRYDDRFGSIGFSLVKLVDTFVPCAKLSDGTRTLRTFVPDRTTVATNRPKELLRVKYGISELCRVHMIQACSESLRCRCDEESYDTSCYHCSSAECGASYPHGEINSARLVG